MEMKTEAQMQKLLNFEGILILIAIGVDILIESLRKGDWGAAAVIIAGFCIIGGLYWHTLYLDRLFAELHRGIQHLLPLSHHETIASSAPRPVSADVPAASVADRPLLHVSNFALSRNFYATILGTLGYTMTLEFPALSMAAFGLNGTSDFWIKGDGVEQRIRASFSTSQKSMVDDFVAAAVGMNATIAETPGPRPERGPGEYAAAVYDPDGYTIEAVFHDPLI